MISILEFIEKACEGSGVQNDSQNVWVEVDGIVCTVPMSDVLDREEKEPFEASFFLENHKDAAIWAKLYEQYLKQSDDEL